MRTSKPTALAAIENKFSKAGNSFTANAKRAMNQNPNYFVWWYTVKSVGLAVAVGTAAYYAGKSVGIREGIREGRQGRFAQ